MLLQLRNSGETFTASSPHMMDLMQQIRLNMIIIIILFGDTIDQLPCPVGTLFRLQISPKSSMFIRMLQMSRYMGWGDQKNSPRIRLPDPCLSYKVMNLFTNWFMVFVPFVSDPKYAIRATSLHWL